MIYGRRDKTQKKKTKAIKAIQKGKFKKASRLLKGSAGSKAARFFEREYKEFKKT